MGAIFLIIISIIITYFIFRISNKKLLNDKKILKNNQDYYRSKLK